MLAILAVVVIHCVSIYTKGIVGTFSGDWWIGTVIQASVRWCVPVFVMLSGSLLLIGNHSDISRPGLKAFYARRIPRIIIPLLFWTGFYSVFHLTRGQGVKDLLENIVRGVPHFHMWFLYMILSLYLVVPFVAYACQKLTSRILVWISIIFIQVGFLIRAMDLENSGGEGSPIFIFSFIPYVGYFILGRVVYDLPDDCFTGKFILAGLALPPAILAGTVGVSVMSGFPEARSLLFSYLNPLIMVQAVSMFFLLAKFDLLGKMFPSGLLRNLSLLTLGLYMIHPFFIYLGRKLVSIPQRVETMGMMLTLVSEFVVITLISFLSALAIRKYVSQAIV